MTGDFRTIMDGPSITSRPKRGRPKYPATIARPNRIVSFVTDKELQQLRQLAAEEERSMAAVVHRIIAQHFRDE